MKKLIPLFVFLLIIGTAAFLVFRQTKSESVVSARLVPADTPLFLSLPDIQASANRWNSTSLAKMWADPQIRAFLEQPLANIRSSAAARELIHLKETLNPSSAFVALTALESNEPLLVGGFQHDATREEIDSAIAQAKARVREEYPSGKADLELYEGVEIESYSAGEFHVANATVDDWFLVSNNQALLRQTLDRLQGRDDSPALDSSETYRKLLGKLPSTVETLAIVQPQVFTRRLVTLLESSGNADPEALRALTQLQGIAAATSFEGEDLRDTIYFLGVESPETGKLTMPILDLTTPDTLLMIASRIHNQWQLPDPALDTTGVLQFLAGFFQGLADQDVDVEALKKAFGPEAGVKLDWPAQSPRPELLVTMEVRDRPVTAQLLHQLATRYGPLANVSHQQNAGTDIYTLSLGGFVPVNPMVALDADRLYVSSDAQALRALLGQDSTRSLATTDPWQQAVKKVETPTETFIYLDTRLLFERAYGTLRPMLVFGAGMMPAVSRHIDASKLPTTEAFTNHLGPTVFSQSADADGVLVSSAGPLTINQLVVMGGAGVILRNFGSLFNQ